MPIIKKDDICDKFQVGSYLTICPFFFSVQTKNLYKKKKRLNEKDNTQDLLACIITCLFFVKEKTYCSSWTITKSKAHKEVETGQFVHKNVQNNKVWSKKKGKTHDLL